ncbi:MAG TPA: hypothetical protein VKU91_00165, partial [Acidimicrobiales bacterium]|nr:hypothetical protein [Acidimicrobiales bacterium]
MPADRTREYGWSDGLARESDAGSRRPGLGRVAGSSSPPPANGAERTQEHPAPPPPPPAGPGWRGAGAGGPRSKGAHTRSRRRRRWRLLL